MGTPAESDGSVDSDFSHRRPDYYQSSIETIDLILAGGYNDAVGFCRGNIKKYISRYQGKDGLNDLKKASWYMDLLYAIECFMESGTRWKDLPRARELLEKYGRP